VRRDTAAEAGRKAAATPPLELALGLLGGVVVLALIGFFLLAAIRGEGRGQPQVRVELSAPSRHDPGWLVPFRVVNGGRAPASQLRLEAELALPDGRRERNEVVVDYLAGGAEQEGGFFFTGDPGAGRLTARALGFLEP
jgi:uncharacterized protein (TIGR02588 family)